MARKKRQPERREALAGIWLMTGSCGSCCFRQLFIYLFSAMFLCTVYSWHFVSTILRLVFTVESGLALNILNSIFDSAMFGTTLRNTFVTAALSIVLGFPAPIVLAMIINQIRQQKWKRIVQTTVYIPYFISTVVMVSILNIMLGKQGWCNQ